MLKKYIIGGGITGLIFSFYNPDYTLISENLGGQMSLGFNAGPRYLYDTAESRKLLNDLGIGFVAKKIKVGYKIGDKIVDIPPEDFRKKYYMKSRNTTDMSGYDNTIMNSGQQHFNALIIDMDLLIKKLVEKVQKWKKQNVKTIDSENITLMNDKVLNYDECISTIPLPILLRCAGHRDKAENYNSISTVFCLAESDYIDIKDYDFVYCSGNEPYHRISKSKKGIVLEFNNPFITKKELKELGFNPKKIIIVPFCQVVSGQAMSEFEKIKLIGRYGSWDRKYKTEKVIKEAMEHVGRK